MNQNKKTRRVFTDEELKALYPMDPIAKIWMMAVGLGWLFIIGLELYIRSSP